MSGLTNAEVALCQTLAFIPATRLILSLKGNAEQTTMRWFEKRCSWMKQQTLCCGNDWRRMEQYRHATKRDV